MSEEPHDTLPELIAEIDQALMNTKHMARWARGLYDAFIEQGFTPDQALALTMNQLRPSVGA